MYNRKDKSGNHLLDEVRFNKYGRFLRMTSFDELPEAFNIIKGERNIIETTKNLDFSRVVLLFAAVLL